MNNSNNTEKVKRKVFAKTRNFFFIFCNEMLHSLGDRYQCSEETFCVLLQSKGNKYG
jgi:hypothetical protein